MQDIKTLKKMLSHLWVILNRKQRIQFLGMLVVILIGSLFELLGVSAMFPFIQSIMNPSALLNNPYLGGLIRFLGISDDGSILIVVGIGIVIIYLVKNIFLSYSTYLQVAYSNNTQKDLATLMLKSYMNRPYSYFVENGSGVIMRGVSTDINGVYVAISTLLKLASEGFVIFAIAIYLICTDPFLATGILAVGFVCVMVIVFGIKKMISRLSRIYRSASSRLLKCITQINGGIKDIMVFNRRGLFVDEYDGIYSDSNVANTRVTFVSTVPERVIEAFCISGIIIMVLIRLNMGVEAETFVPKMAAFAVGMFRLLPSVSRVTGCISLLIYSREMVEATYENIVSARHYHAEEHGLHEYVSDTEEMRLQRELEIRDLHWKYPEGKEEVLNGLNLVIRKGEAVGIVGESGAGKSTMADILLRLYKPQKGGIYMDGIDINTIPETWSRIIAYVPQVVFLLDDTVRANVAFGATDYTDDDIWEALRRASIEEFIRGLPEGLDTVIGERGIKFSGGQRQRVAIARALFIKPQIMILDEATSALDNETEEAVMEAIDSLAGSVTLVIIAHRVTTLRNCDSIYEIVSGKAVLRDKERIIKIEGNDR